MSPVVHLIDDESGAEELVSVPTQSREILKPVYSKWLIGGDDASKPGPVSTTVLRYRRSASNDVDGEGRRIYRTRPREWFMMRATFTYELMLDANFDLDRALRALMPPDAERGTSRVTRIAVDVETMARWPAHCGMLAWKVEGFACQAEGSLQ